MELNQTQVKYPLSNRKFWKKIVSRTLLSSILLFILTAVLVIVLIGLGSEIIVTSYVLTSVLTGILFFVGFLFLLVIGPYAWYVNQYIQRYHYSLDENFITIRKGVFTPSEIHVQYQKIQDVYVDQDLLDRIFGIYDVHIASATVSSGIEAHIDGVSAASAEGLKNELLDKIQHRSVAQTTDQKTVATAQLSQSKELLAQNISSATYPISGRWLTGIILSTIFHFIYTLGIILVYFFFGLKDLNASDKIWVLLAGAIIAIGGILVRLIYNIIWKKNYYFEFQPEYIVLKQGVISREERHIQYSSIQNVTLKQRISDRVLGLCDVVIENASMGGGGMSLNTSQSRRMGIVGSNGIIIPGQLLENGKKLVEIVNKIAVDKNVNANPNGL